MTQPLFFMPDPGIEDSDLLGYGDLIFDDGSRMFVDGDPDIASQYPRPEQAQPIDFGDSSTRMGQTDLNPMVPIPGSDATVDISTGEIQSGGALADVPMPQFDDELERMGQTEVEQLGTRVPVGESGATVDISTGEIQPPPTVGAQPGAPAAGYGTGGLQLAQREGALPPGVAQDQALERQQQNLLQQQALEQSRAAEAKIYRDAALARQGELDADRAELQRQQAERQQKITRWQDEQKLTADMEIKTDLVSAIGETGSVMAVLAAALGGYLQDDGRALRMIDSAIDTNVKKQLNQRDTKLRLLADRLESTQQAMAAGKAEMYKLLAERAETVQKLTQASVFEAQTPGIVQELKSKQLAYEQQQEQLSLGKTTEKAPQPMAGGLTPAQRALQTSKYGAAATNQENAQNDIERAALQLGLAKWDAKTGQFKNRQEVLDGGIKGVGRVDSFFKTLGKVPVVGALPQALDEATTSDRGLANRAAIESLVAAEAKRQNPVGVISEGDIQRARESLGSLTEEGLVAAVERLMAYQPTVQTQNRATFGEQAAQEYDQQRGPVPQPGGAEFEKLQPGSAREQIQQYRQQPRQGTTTVDGQPQGANDVTPEQRMAETADYVTAIAGRELPPEGIDILVAQAAHETGNGQSAPGNNMFGHKANKAGRSSGSRALMTTEGEGKGAQRVRQNFASFGSVADSVADHVDLLKRKYPEAWRALEAGDPNAYVAALKDGGYFTGNETVYANSILGLLQARQDAYEEDLDPEFNPDLESAAL